MFVGILLQRSICSVVCVCYLLGTCYRLLYHNAFFSMKDLSSILQSFVFYVMESISNVLKN